MTTIYLLQEEDTNECETATWAHATEVGALTHMVDRQKAELDGWAKAFPATKIEVRFDEAHSTWELVRPDEDDEGEYLMGWTILQREVLA